MQDELISRQAAIDAVNDVIADYVPNLFGRYEALPLEMASAVNRLPSVNPQRTGHWIQTQEKDDAEPFILWECSECHKEFRSVVHKVSNYCPDCGAKMVEPQESEEEE